MRAVLDTNILVDYLTGIEAAKKELLRYRQPLISRITWMEVMTGVAPGDPEAPSIRNFLSSFGLVEVDEAVAEQAVQLRRDLRLRLPDAIILASARIQQCPLVTRNTRDFNRNWPDIRVPYTV
ncbi:MAG: type II toxin-antitoxin system VapC family toxin [Kiritimatiellia bacterium]